ncbi:MAG TPA: response regulator transcription factor [Actinomycetota bacterium]|nr:response regulator transcription factor [Actinomycetota bacterium]
MTRALLIEDQSLFAEVVAAALRKGGIDVVGICSTGAEGLRAAQRLSPDLVLVDVGLPDQSGLLVGMQIIDNVEGAKVVALTGQDDPRAVREAISAGFAGFLTKDLSTIELLKAIQVIREGKRVVRQHLQPRRQPFLPTENGSLLLSRQLTHREREVLSLLSRGVSGRDIGERLGVSGNTVRSHVQTILSKLQVHSRAEAVAFALQNGLVDAREQPGPGSAA